MTLAFSPRRSTYGPHMVEVRYDVVALKVARGAPQAALEPIFSHAQLRRARHRKVLVGATLKLIASACPDSVNRMTALPCASSANARLWLAHQAMWVAEDHLLILLFYFFILRNFQRYTGATDDARTTAA